MSERKELLSTAMRRTSEWILSLEIPSDVTVNVEGTSFSLHKFPLVSKCGYMKKLVSRSTSFDVSIVDIPGGANAFEHAAKFCYGVNFTITAENVVMLRCVAEFLEMTEQYVAGNLIARTEAFINQVVLKSLTGAIAVLHSCERFVPLAERVKLVSRCVDTVAFLACQDSQFIVLDNIASPNVKPAAAWWAECLTILRIDFFQRVVAAMIARGFNQCALGPVLMLYAQTSLRGLQVVGKSRNKKIDPGDSHVKRVVLETIVSLLPKDKNTVPITFLSMLLRATMFLETTVACRLDLEKRIASQFDQATLDDILIPAVTGDTLFDIEIVKRIMVGFLELYKETNKRGYNEGKNSCSPSPNTTERATGLMESYLIHVASDSNLSVLEFISLAELIPQYCRSTEDGMYRAIDVYLKAHPALSDMERNKVCSVMDFGKLSLEARAHVAKNDRLPVQTIVRVLCHEQRRIREVMDDNLGHAPPPLPKGNSLGVQPAPDEVSVSVSVSTLQRENKDLKIELVKMKTRLKEMEQCLKKLPPDAEGGPLPTGSKFEKSPLPWKSFISSVSRRFGRFVIWGDGSAVVRSRSNEPRKVRRHSVS